MNKAFQLVVLICWVTTSAAQTIPKWRIDPSQAYGGYVSEYFNSVEYIPLETTKESLFGDIAQMVITDSSIVVSDLDTKSIYFFSPAGKYITKVKMKDHQMVANLSIDGESKEIVIVSYHPVLGISHANYTFTGTRLEHNKLLKNQSTGLTSIGGGYFVQFNSCYFSPDQKPKDSVFYLINIYKGSELYKSLLPYNQSMKKAFCLFGGTLSGIQNNQCKNGSFYISTPYEHMLYKITKDTAFQVYQFVFPAKRVIADKIIQSNDLPYLDSVRRNTQNSTEIIVDVRNVLFYKNLLLFKLNPGKYIFNTGSVNESQYNFIYDTVSGKLVSLEHMTPDKKCFYLPLLGNGMMTIMNGLYFLDGSFYSAVSSLQMFTSEEKNRTNNPQYSSALKEYFRTQNRKSNPVIVRMKLKE
jgi:hypothetical protein